MPRKIAVLLAAAIVATGVIPLAVANNTRDPTEDEKKALQAEIDAFRAAFDAPSTMTAEEAVTTLVAKFTGEPVSEAALVEAAKLLRDAKLAQTDAAATVGREFAETYLDARKLAVARELVADKAGFDALVPRLADMTPAEARGAFEALGMDVQGAIANADLLAAAWNAPVDSVRGWLTGPHQRDVWYQDAWDFYGVVVTLAYLTVASQAPDLAGEILPHNARINAFFLDLRILSGLVGNFLNGYLWIQLDLELLLGLAYDLHLNVDSLLLQLPLSIRLELHWQFVCSGWSCSFRTWLVVLTPDTLIAADPVFDFAYPAIAGSFPTRATSMDIFQSVYDRLGYLRYQKAQEPTAAPAYAATPGLGDLSTQAPKVNYFGTQLPTLPVAAPAAPALPVAPPAAAPETHTRLRDTFGALPAPVDSVGLVAGYEASAIRAWTLNILIVRWHDVGTATTGVLPESPASIYYDAAWHFTKGAGNVLTSDWSIVEDVVAAA